MYLYELNNDGFIVETYHTASDINIPDSCIDEQLPNPLPFHAPKWNGKEWVEGATQEEIDEITKVEPQPSTDTEILGQQMTEREIEAMIQGQQLSDIELRLLALEVK